MKKISFLLLSLAALGACKKDGENTPSASRTDLLTAKNWRVASQTTTLTLAGTTTTSTTIDACDKDDFIKFNTDKSAVHDQGATKCDPTDPQTDKGTWDLPGDQSKLTVNLASYGNTTFDVKELTATTMHLYTTQSQSGIAYTADITFTAF